MVFLGNNFVNGVVVVKGHEAESSLLPGGPLLHDVNAFNLSIFLEILPDMVLLRVLLDTADKDLLHCQMGARFVGVLSGDGPLGFNDSSVHFMRPCFHGVVYLCHRRVCYKAEAP